jgi:hypothetical protein
MKYDDLSEFSSETSIGTIRVRTLDLENGLLILITDKDRFRLGLSAVAIPPGQGSLEPTSTGLFSMGLDNALVRTVAERVASWTNRTCMIVSGLPQMNRETMLEIMSLLRDHFVT